MGELPHGLHHGNAFEETFIKVLAYSSVLGLTSFVLVLWGLRIVAPQSPTEAIDATIKKIME